SGRPSRRARPRDPQAGRRRHQRDLCLWLDREGRRARAHHHGSFGRGQGGEAGVMTESSHEALLEQTTGVSDAKPTFSAWRRVISTVLSSFLPGIGQLILHRRKSGLVLLSIFSLIAICSVAFRLFLHYVALI